YRAPAGNHDLLPGQNETEAGDGLQYFQDRQWLVLFIRRAGNRIENIDGHDVGTDLLEGKRKVAAVLARLAHANDAAGTNLEAGFFQIADGFEAVVVGVRGAGFWKKTAGTLQVMAITLDSRLLQTIGDPLAFDDAE